MEPAPGAPPSVFKTAEGKLLVLAIAFAVLTLAAVGILYPFKPTLAKAILACAGFNLIGGRAPGVGVFIFNACSPYLAIVSSVWVEFVIVLFCYAIFVLTVKNYIHYAWLKRLIHDAESAVHKNEMTIQRYGWFGLMIFVLIPLPFTGPLMGSYIGYLLRFKFVRNFSAVMLGTGIAVSLWAFLFDYLENNLHVFQEVFFGLVLLLVVIFFPKIMRFGRYLVRVIRSPHHAS